MRASQIAATQKRACLPTCSFAGRALRAREWTCLLSLGKIDVCHACWRCALGGGHAEAEGRRDGEPTLGSTLLLALEAKHAPASGVKSLTLQSAPINITMMARQKHASKEHLTNGINPRDRFSR